MPDDTEQQTAAEQPAPAAPLPPSEIVAIAKNAAQQVAQQLIDEGKQALVDGAKAAIDAAWKDTPAPEGMPAIMHPAWDGLKDWVRQELDLALQGIGPGERKSANP